jgi:hypothetical protein
LAFFNSSNNSTFTFSSSYLLQVPPTIEEGERLLRVVEGGQLAIECPANGVPTPTLVWRTANGEVLEAEVDEATGRERLMLRDLKPTDGKRCGENCNHEFPGRNFSSTIYYFLLFLLEFKPYKL